MPYVMRARDNLGLWWRETTWRWGWLEVCAVRAIWPVCVVDEESAVLSLRQAVREPETEQARTKTCGGSFERIGQRAIAVFEGRIICVRGFCIRQPHRWEVWKETM